MGRELTEEEVRRSLIETIRRIIARWEATPDSQLGPNPQRRRILAIVSEILMVFDGFGELPAFIVAPDPHPDERKFARANGVNYYPENYHVSDKVCADVAGILYEDFLKLITDNLSEEMPERKADGTTLHMSILATSFATLHALSSLSPHLT